MSYPNSSKLRFLIPKPWENCTCAKCWEYMFRDLMRCTKKSNSPPFLRHVHNGLARWSVWMSYRSLAIGSRAQVVPYFPGQLDSSTSNYLKSHNITNWWFPVANMLYPIVIKGDGNCLPHAVSTYLWGVQDVTMTLRNLIHQTLVTSGTELFRERWKREKEWHNAMIPDGGLQYDEEEWNKEWTLLVDAAQTYRQDLISNLPRLPYESLEELHIFVLANVLRRPIIVLGPSEITSMADGKAIEYNNMVGIYLPLLWPSKQCYKYPVVLSFLFNHLEPLLSELAGGVPDALWHKRNVVPLVTSSMEMLRVHFTLLEEETKLHNLLQNYLHVEEISFTKDGSMEFLLVAHLPMPEETIISMPYYIRRRPFTPRELQFFRVDKELVYEQRPEKQIAPDEACYQHLMCQMCMIRYITILGPRAFSRKRKDFSNFGKYFFYLILQEASLSRPIYTILNEQEFDDKLEKMRSSQAEKSPKRSALSKMLEQVKKLDKDVGREYDDELDDYYDDGGNVGPSLLVYAGGDKAFLLTSRNSNTAPQHHHHCAGHRNPRGEVCHCHCHHHHHHHHEHSWDMRNTLALPKSSKNQAKMTGGGDAGGFNDSSRKADNDKESMLNYVDYELDGIDTAGVQGEKSSQKQNAERKQKILHSTSKSFKADESTWGEEMERSLQELSSTDWNEAGWEKSPGNQHQYSSSLDNASNENVNDFRFQVNSDNINNNNFTHDRHSDDISSDINSLSENSRDVLNSDITGTSTPINITRRKQDYRNREVDLNCSNISDIEKSATSRFDTETHSDNSSTCTKTEKCANVACTRIPQERSAYCKTCDFQQRTVQMTLQSDTFGATGGNSFLELFQSISAQSQDKRNWKTISSGREKSEDNLD